METDTGVPEFHIRERNGVQGILLMVHAIRRALRDSQPKLLRQQCGHHPRACSLCRQPGHNSVSCPLKGGQK